MALCNESLVELANSGASGSLFYVTNDDEFIVKTVQHKEAEFLQKLLPGYYLVSWPCMCWIHRPNANMAAVNFSAPRKIICQQN